MSQMCPSCSHDNADGALYCARCAEPLRGLLGSNTLLAGRYCVTRVLGCGGMGAVYLADDLRIRGRQVAIKENLDPTAYAQFQAEVNVMTALSHPGLPAISDQFVGATGRQYLVMDFIAGEDLEELLRRRGPLPEDEVIALAIQVLHILEYIHRHGVVHRDIKPANIKLRPDGRLVLVDFGIAKQQMAGGRTQTWARQRGTPGFASVEHYTGGTDARSDLYGLGAVMYYLLTGKVPPEALRLAAGAPLTPLQQLCPDLSSELQRIIFRAMAPAPAQRYQSASEMRAALTALTTQSSVSSPPSSPPKGRLILAMGGIGVVILLSVAITHHLAIFPSLPTPAVIAPGPAPLSATVHPGATAATIRPTHTEMLRPTDMPSRGVLREPTSVPTASTTPKPTLTARPSPTRTRRPPTSTYTPTRVPPTATARPTSTLTPTPLRPIASNVAGFSGNQGANSWWYQVEQGRNSGTFADFPHFGPYGSPSRNCWQTPQEGHVRICPEGEVHPGVTGRIAYRWRSSVSRKIRVTVHAHKIDTRCGDGVWIGVYRVPQNRSPEKIGEFSIGGAEYRDRPANTYRYDMDIGAGDWVMIMVDIRGDSGCDQTRLYVDIY